MVVSGGTTTLRLSATTRRVLDVAGVHLDAASGATTGEGRLSFPITGGRLRFTPLRGHIEHRGALRIRAGGRSVKLTNLVVDPGRKRITGDLAGRRIPLMSLDFAMPRTPPPAGGPVILPAKATLLASSAVSTLGDQFGVHALKAGLPLGSVYIAARPAGGA
jgi:hypothetical protein